MKRCTKCDEEKSLDQFSKNKTKPDGVQSQCKACCSAQDKARYQAAPEKIRERSRAQYAADKERQLQNRKIRYQRNREVELGQMRDWAARNRDTSRSIKARWAANNIGYVNAKTATRRIARVRATPQWVPVEAFKPIYDAARVASELTGEACHVDHIVPSQGKGVSGLHVPWNLRVIFAKDNLSKGAKFIEELVA